MTVATTQNRKSYSGNGSQVDFPYPFKIFQDSDLVVKVRDSNGVETTLTLTTDYTVTGAGAAAGGTVTTLTTYASGYTIIILRQIPLKQLVDYVENDDFPAETHEGALDRGVMISQQVSEETGRAIKMPESSPLAGSALEITEGALANKILGFDAAGTAIELKSTAAVVNPDFYTIGDYDDDLAQAISDIGASSVTLLINTQVNVTVNATIPANIFLWFLKEGSFNISAGVVVTISGGMNGGMSTRFTGAGTVAFPTGSGYKKQSSGVAFTRYAGLVKELIPQWWGALGDNSNDDGAAINAMATAAQPGCKIYFPACLGYKTTIPIVIGNNIDVVMDAPIIYTNTDNTTCLSIGDNGDEDLARNLTLWVIRDATSDHTSESSIGIKLTGIQNGHVVLRRSAGFTIAMQLVGDGTTNSQMLFNNFFLGELDEFKIGIDIINANSGYVNENKFYGGDFRCASATNPTINKIGVRSTATTQTNQANVFYGPAFQLGYSGGHTSLPFYIDGDRAYRAYDIRHESNSGPIAQLENNAGNNGFEIGHDSANDNPTTLTDNSVPAGNDRTRDNFVLTYVSNGLSGGHANKYMRPLWHSGNLLDRFTYVDGGTNVHIPGIAHFNGAVALLSSLPKYKSGGAPQSVTGFYTPNAGDGIGVFIDTAIAKKFILRRDADVGFTGRVRFIAFDSDGNILVDNPTVQHILQRDLVWSATSFGGSYGHGNDASATEDVYFEVGSSVKKVAVILVNGTAALRIRSFSLYLIDAVVPHGSYAAVYPGYDEVMPGARLIDGSVPTAGTYERGAILLDKTATSGAAQGQVCTSSGTFSAATDNAGDTTNGSATITGMADTSDFNVGDFVTVSAGFGAASPLGEAIFKILDIQAATITLDTAADATQANVTVATVNPVFKALANLA